MAINTMYVKETATFEAPFQTYKVNKDNIIVANSTKKMEEPSWLWEYISKQTKKNN